MLRLGILRTHDLWLRLCSRRSRNCRLPIEIGPRMEGTARGGRCYVFVSSLDYLRPSATRNRHIDRARDLVRMGIDCHFLVVRKTDLRPLRQIYPDIHWECPVRGVRTSEPRRWDRLIPWAVDRYVESLPGHVDAIICYDRDPFVIAQVRRLRRKLSTSVLLHELTEYPDVVAPRGIYGRFLVVAFWRAHIKSFDGVIVITTALSEFVRSITGGAVQIMRLPVYVALDRLQPAWSVADSRRSSASFTVGYAGSLVVRKDGLDRAIKAIAYLRRDHIDRDIRMEVWGDGEDRRELELLASSLGLRDVVRFHGLIDSDTLFANLRKMDCLVLPRPQSRQAVGGMPTKFAEYLATGRPVVSTDTGDIGLFAQGGVNCELVPPDDILALAKAISSIADDPTYADALGRRGRLLAESQFSAREAAQLLVAFVDAIRKGR